MSLLAQVALLALVMAVVTVIALIAGAANLGTALGVGQIAFTATLAALLLKR